MNLFFAELNILAVSIIGVLLVVVVPEIMLNVMSRTGKSVPVTGFPEAAAFANDPACGGPYEPRFAENLQALVVLTFST